jgi:hypothetical protein
MARREARPPAEREVRLTPRRMHCVNCELRLWVAYHAQRTLMTFWGLVRLILVARRCRNQHRCPSAHQEYDSGAVSPFKRFAKRRLAMAIVV